MSTGNLIDDRKTRNYSGGGIYAIINKRNGKMYIGSSNDISKRIKQHEISFKNTECNPRIKKDVISGDKFYSEILEKIELPYTLRYLLEKEREYSVKYGVVKNGYNMMYVNYTSKDKVIKNNYERITVTVEKGKKDKYLASAKAEGLSLSDFIEKCVDERISDSKAVME